ncbi:MAG: maleylpyruvate isomerase family mycothiol-dependent enzyme [Mycobacteriales bacterium]
MADSVWPLVHAERAALAADLDGLTSEQWDTPSLCEGWSVHDLLAHQVSTARLTPLGFFGALIGSGLSFSKFAAKGVAAGKEGGPAATLQAYRDLEKATTSPPGPKDSWLGEEIVHGEDIRRPLGLMRAYPAASVTRVLDFYKKSNTLLGTKKRIAGVTLKATDLDWSHGSGPLVEGPALSLLMAGTGRRAHLADLTGPGVEVLAAR